MTTLTMPAENVTVTGSWSINSYTLTVKYVGPDGDTQFAAPDATQTTLNYGDTYSIPSPAVEGYTASPTNVQGTMPASDVEVTVNYTINSYTVTYKVDGVQYGDIDTYNYGEAVTECATPTAIIGKTFRGWIWGYTGGKPDTMPAQDILVTGSWETNLYPLTVVYQYTDGTEAASATSTSLVYGAAYSITSPVIEGYTANYTVVTGTMPDSSRTVTVTYTINSHTLTVNYNYATGAKAAESDISTLDYNQAYNVVSPVIPGYVASPATVSGTMPDADVTEHVVYTATNTTYTVKHYKANLDGSYNATADATDSMTGITGELTAAEAKTYEGFTAQTFEQIAIAGDGSTVVDIYYTRNIYTLTVKYVGPDDGTFAAPATHTERLKYGASYSVASPAVEGYTPDAATASGTMPASNTSITVTYTANTNTAYTVKHYKANLDGSYNAAPDATDNMTGTTGQPTNAAAKTYEGFTAQTFEQIAIAGDGSTVVDIYYTRNIYTLTVKYVGPDDGTFAAPATHTEQLKYGASYSVASPAVDGYAPDTATVTGTMPATDTSITVTYTANSNTAYTVEHYKANLDGSYNATADDTDSMTGTTGQLTAAVAKSYEGFTAGTVTQATIAGDGSTVVKIYYTRNSYTLNILYQNASGIDIAPSVTRELQFEAAYSETSPTVPSYQAPSIAVVAGNMPAKDLTIVVTYTKTVVPTSPDPTPTPSTNPSPRPSNSPAPSSSPVPSATPSPAESPAATASANPETIQDDDTPLAGGTENIPDDGTPLARPVWALLNLILAILTALTSVLLIVFGLGKKKQEAEEEGDEAYTMKKKLGWRLASIIPGVGAIIAFILTEDMTNPMVFTDKWTLLMVVIALVQVLVALLSNKKKKLSDEESIQSGI